MRTQWHLEVQSMTYRNLVEMHRLQAEALRARTALRFKRDGEVHDLSWEQYRSLSMACAAALLDVGIQPGDRVGLLAENRVEWFLSDMGLLTAGAVCVPPHAPLTAKQVQFQLADAGASWLFVSTLEQLEKIRLVRRELPSVRGIVLFDECPTASDAVTWQKFLERGRQVLPRWKDELIRREAGLSPDHLATIMYTSGTTGNPKGVMLTHGNLISNAVAAEKECYQGPDGLVLNWLPLSHIFARLVDHYANIAGGTTVALAESPDTVVADLKEFQPTRMASVPRFFEKVLSAVASPDPKETSRRLREVFGPRMEWLTSGGAPLPLAVFDAYEAAGLRIYPGYGLTETSPIISFNSRERRKPGTVGPPLPGVEVKIAPDGEILSRGPHVMKGYWNNPQATAEAIHDGWLHTGDLGRLDEDGFLIITGRKKELLVLSSGKKVVPTYIEGLLLSDPCIDQAMICGEGRHYLVALIVPQWDNLREAVGMPDAKLAEAPAEDLVRHPAVLRELRKRIDAALVDVSSWEQVKRFALLPRPFSVANDELTVSLKTRRSVVLERYRDLIDKLYRE
jgi:long-chain acyl-CoA synthetase